MDLPLRYVFRLPVLALIQTQAALIRAREWSFLSFMFEQTGSLETFSHSFSAVMDAQWTP